LHYGVNAPQFIIGPSPLAVSSRAAIVEENIMRCAKWTGALLALLYWGSTMATAQELSSGGYSIFDETMVDMHTQEIEAASKKGAILLWPLGVIEEHGPQLPLGTDIYNSYLTMKKVARLLRARGKDVLIAPPMYWGINDATGAFGGSLSVKPATLKAIIEDTFASFRKDGFESIYMITGHGDRLHNQVIIEGVEASRSSTGMRGFVLIPAVMKDRLGLKGTEAQVIVLDPPAASLPVSKFVEVHAGMVETSTIWRNFPKLVDADAIPKLPDTQFGPDDLAEWRKGWANARTKTPLGYLGDPASADPKRGELLFDDNADRVANAIQKHMEASVLTRK
jgi:creatinine amidohydrolase